MAIGPETAEGLRSGTSLIIGTVSSAGRPHANRAWGAVVSDDGSEVRVMIDADDDALLANLRGTGRVAVTGADVRTFRSVQVKGTVRALEELTAKDHADRERATDRFLTEVEEVDRTPRAYIEALVPARFVACVVAIEERYDQTPGPAAGRSLATGASGA